MSSKLLMGFFPPIKSCIMQSGPNCKNNSLPGRYEDTLFTGSRIWPLWPLWHNECPCPCKWWPCLSVLNYFTGTIVRSVYAHSTGLHQWNTCRSQLVSLKTCLERRSGCQYRCTLSYSWMRINGFWCYVRICVHGKWGYHSPVWVPRKKPPAPTPWLR